MNSERPTFFADSERRFSSICESYSRIYAQLDPVVSSAIGTRRQNRQLLDRVCEYRDPFPLLPERRDAIKNHLLTTRIWLKEISSSHLNPHAEHFYRVLSWDLDTRLELLKNATRFIPFGSQQLSMLWELPLDGSGKGRQSFQTIDDYENFIAQMEEFPEWVGWAKNNLREGKSRGYTQSKILIAATIKKLEAFLVDNQVQDTTLHPIKNMPENFSDSDKLRLGKNYNLVYDQAIYQQYVLMYNYLHQYFPSGRENDQVGMTHLPNGLEEYQRLVRFHTSSNMSLETLAEIVDMELEASLEGIDSCRAKARFQGGIKDFIVEMEKKFSTQLFVSPAELRDFHDRINEDVERVLPYLVSHIPTPRYDLELAEGDLAQGATAQYRKASHNGPQHATFWLPFRPDPNIRIDNSTNMVRTIFHEGSLGHHLQASLQNESNVPTFMHHTNFPAFAEGWAMHAERLGSAFVYPDNIDIEFAIQYTRLCIARAAKFDMGLHALGWSLDEARSFRRRYFGETGKSEDMDIIRMAEWPAQVLSYLIGAPTISGIKSVLRNELKDKYNERVVNTALLEKGSMPLELLPLVGEQVLENLDPQN